VRCVALRVSVARTVDFDGQLDEDWRHRDWTPDRQHTMQYDADYLAFVKFWSPVYTTQPVVKPVVKPVWQPVVSCIQTFNRFGLTNGCIVYTAGCQNGCTTRFDNRLNEQWLFVQHGCQTGLNPFDNRFDNLFDNRLYRVYEHSTGCHPWLKTGLFTSSIARSANLPVFNLLRDR